MPKRPEDPKVTAMLMCDHAHQDPGLGKWFLLGIFDQIACKRFPATLRPFSVYLNLTNLNGKYDIELQIVRGRDEAVLAGCKGVGIESKNPLQRAELGLQVPSLRIAEPGRLLFRLLANDNLIHDVAFEATKGAST